jgi:hypothetical protein
VIVTVHIARKRIVATAANRSEFYRMGDKRYATRAGCFIVSGPELTIEYDYQRYAADEAARLMVEDEKRIREGAAS